MDAVSIFIVGGSAATELRHVFEEWTTARLLRPSLWLLPESDDAAAEDTRTTVLAPDGCHESRLLDALATNPFATVRVITVRLPGGHTVDDVDQRAEQVTGVVERSLAPDQRLELLNVIVPTSASALLPPDAFASTARANARSIVHVLVSPEDRRSEMHTSRGVGDRVAAHAAAAVATVSGCWRLMAAAPFDGVDPVGSADDVQIIPVRSFARLIEAPELADLVTAELHRLRDGDGWMARAADAMPASDPPRVVDGFVHQLTEHETALRCAPFTSKRRRPHQAIGRWAALLLMLRFIFDRTRELPALILGRLRSLVEKIADEITQNITFGDDSWVRVSGRAARALRDADDAADPESNVAAQVLADLGQHATPKSTAELWRTLRAVSFASLDGGAFPEPVTPPMDGTRRLVLPDAHAVVPDPEDPPFKLDLDSDTPFTTLPEWAWHPIAATDSAAATRLGELLEQRQADARSGIPDSTDADGQTVSAVPADDDAADRLGEATTALEAFVDRHRPSLWCGLGTAIEQERRTAARAFADAVQTVEATSATADKQRIRRLLRRLWIQWAAALVTGTALAVTYAWFRDELPWDVSWVIVAAVVAALVFLWWFAAFVPYQRDLFRIRYRLDQRHETLVNALSAMRHYAHEVVLLRSIYNQLLEWAQVVAQVVHRPAAPEAHLDESNEPSNLTVPAAVRVALGEPDDRARQRVAAIVTRQMFAPGWLTNLFVQVRDQAMQELKLSLGLDSSARDPDPDSELADHTPRAFLHAHLVSDKHADAWHAELVERIEAALRTLPSDELFATVRTLRGANEDVLGNGTTFTAERFVDEIIPRSNRQHLSRWVWAPAARFEAAERIAGVHLWTTDTGLSVASVRGVPVTVEESVVVTDSRYWAQCLRIDIGLPCRVADLAVPADERGGATPSHRPQDAGVW